MTFRITDSNTNSTSARRVNAHRSQISILQERLATGKRINRASDDPQGAEAVINIRTSQTEIAQFKRNASAVKQKLTVADDSLGNYENILDRVKTLISQGMSGTATQEAKNAIAVELESLRERILAVANSKSGGEFVFGGDRQNEPPFDPTTAAPSSTPSSVRYVQIEPGTTAIPSGVTAESFLSDTVSDIFTDLTDAVAALRGTGDADADRATLQNTFSRLDVYSDLASITRARIGANSNTTDLALENLSGDYLSLDLRAKDIEGADFASTVIELTESEQALEATLQVIANGRRSLFDYI